MQIPLGVGIYTNDVYPLKILLHSEKISWTSALEVVWRLVRRCEGKVRKTRQRTRYFFKWEHVCCPSKGFFKPITITQKLCLKNREFVLIVAVECSWYLLMCLSVACGMWQRSFKNTAAYRFNIGACMGAIFPQWCQCKLWRYERVMVYSWDINVS